MKIDRQKVLDKYGGKCAYCGCELTLKTMQVDHLIPQVDIKIDFARGKSNLDKLTNIDNLMPACQSCNNYKSNGSLEEMRKNLSRLQIQLERISIFRIAKRYGIAQLKEWDSKFYFEKNEATNEKAL